uniref:Uncharacterized protein n=1 Tax=Sphaerodactylus townsendi TaxID=933632 RepID=A0ACB8G3G9_9SAUR
MTGEGRAIPCLPFPLLLWRRRQAPVRALPGLLQIYKLDPPPAEQRLGSQPPHVSSPPLRAGTSLADRQQRFLQPVYPRNAQLFARRNLFSLSSASA